MTSRMRIKNILFAICMIAMAFIIVTYKDEGYLFVIAFLSISLLLYSIKQFIYFFSMARYMVGGKLVLYKAIILLNFAMIVWNLSEIPKGLVMIYLVLGLVFSGVIDVLRGFETKRQGSRHWKIKVSQGAVIIVISIVSLFFIKSTYIVTYIYCAGLVVSAISKISESFRKTAIVYIS